MVADRGPSGQATLFYKSSHHKTCSRKSSLLQQRSSDPTALLSSSVKVDVIVTSEQNHSRAVFYLVLCA